MNFKKLPFKGKHMAAMLGFQAKYSSHIGFYLSANGAIEIVILENL